MKKVLQVEATIQKVETLADRSIRLRVDTQEMQPEDEATLMGLRGRLGWFVFSDNLIEQKDIPQVQIDKEAGESKTPSQRLRNVIYRFWENNTNKSIEFDSFYKKQIEFLINQYKDKL